MSDEQSTPPIAPKRKRGRPPKVLSEAPNESQTSSGTAWDALRHPEKYVSPPKMHGFAAQEAEVLRTDAPREQLNVRVRSELKRAIQIMAAAQNISLGDVIEEALIDYINKNRQVIPAGEVAKKE